MPNLISISRNFIIQSFLTLLSTRLHGGGGVYLSDKDVEIGSDPFMYWQTNLADQVTLGHFSATKEHFATKQVWSYDVDVSNVACKCNAAMYWVNMPGYENGNPYPAE